MALTMQRPAIIIDDGHTSTALDAEYRAARWTYHRLLDFEDQHQQHLDAVAEEIAPGVVRVGRILARLQRRTRWRARASEGNWSPDPRPHLQGLLRTRLADLRKQRNADPRWQAALRWADEPVGEPKAVRRRRAKAPEKLRRRKNETQEAWDERFALLTQDETEEHYRAKVAAAPRDTRREVYRKALYAERRIYWGTWNDLIASVDQARAAVLKQRRAGLPGKWRRPRWSDEATLHADTKGIRVVSRGTPWWVVELPIGRAGEVVRFRAKFGNWHAIPAQTALLSLRLTRRRDGERWKHSATITVDMNKPTDRFASRGVVSLDWGHREHGHPRASDGLRAFTWLGDDGELGEVLVPRECRELLDRIGVTAQELDTAFNARKRDLGLQERNRYAYRRRLFAAGVRTAEQARWLAWEMKRERQLARMRRRIANLRRHAYMQAVQQLRSRYAVVIVEDESVEGLRQTAKQEQQRRRVRSNRDLAARYEFIALCERFGATLVTVSARNTTRECPDCGNLDPNGTDLLVACSKCGRVRDKDQGACRVILQRGLEALATDAPSQ